MIILSLGNYRQECCTEMSSHLLQLSLAVFSCHTVTFVEVNNYSKKIQRFSVNP